jgi:hypothetical protein
MSKNLLFRFLFALGGVLRAQTQEEITGEVTDASGAVLPGVAITVTNENTNV